MSVDEDQHFTSVHHGTDPYGKSSLRHLIHISIEEATISDDRIRRERLHSGTRC